MIHPVTIVAGYNLRRRGKHVTASSVLNLNRKRVIEISQKTAKQEIEEFLLSKELGIRSEFTRVTLVNAAQTLFTANGQACPVIIKQGPDGAYLINRDILSRTDPSSSDLNATS